MTQHAPVRAPSRPVAADRPSDLARLQIETLQRFEQPAAPAEERGFRVLSRGSSRVAVGLPNGTVAKVAHNLVGLAMNLQEAAIWQSFPEEFRQHLTPCLALSPQLVLTQAKVDVIGSIPERMMRYWRDADALAAAGDEEAKAWDAWYEAREAEGRQVADEIYATRAELGLDRDPDIKLRLDNHGRHEGRVVLIDYGDQFPPMAAVWAELLNDERPQTWRTLAEHSGLIAENPKDCPCGCGEAFAALPTSTRCVLDGDVAELLSSWLRSS